MSFERIKRTRRFIYSRSRKRNLQDKVSLKGSFCKGKCNREGVTVQVDDELYTGITPEKFTTFFEENVASKLQ